MPPPPSPGIARRHHQVGQTAVTILAEERFHQAAVSAISSAREEIERFISHDPLFRDTLEPYHEPRGAPDVVKAMCAAARRAGVGPMAAVAGAIAQEAVRAMVGAGAKHAVVDNGGDIALFLDREVDVGIYAGDSPLRDMALRVPPQRRHLAICTSSGTVGPSISFGIADAAVVLAADAALADACATRLGNEAQSQDEGGMAYALDVIMEIEGVEGAMLVVGGRVALRGRLPQLVRGKVGEDSIARRRY